MTRAATDAAKTPTTKTAKRILESVDRKGFFVGQGKRIMQAARQLESAGLLPSGSVSVLAFNGNGHKSQWNSPRFIAAYETTVTVPRALRSRGTDASSAGG